MDFVRSSVSRRPVASRKPGSGAPGRLHLAGRDVENVAIGVAKPDCFQRVAYRGHALVPFDAINLERLKGNSTKRREHAEPTDMATTAMVTTAIPVYIGASSFKYPTGS